MMSILFFSLHLIAASVSSTLADSSSAVAFYDQGKFAEALQSFEADSPQTAADYYNRGNSHFKLGHLGQALAFYEKANSLAPRHPDIRYNRDLVEEILRKNGGLPHDPSLWRGVLIPRARQIPEIFLWLWGGAILMGGGLFLRRLPKRLTPAVISCFLIVLTLLIADVTFLVAAHAPLAVVVAESAQARSGPATTFTELFKLPAGAKVELSGQSRDGWQQIRFSLGNIGWIVEKDLLPL